MSEIKPGDFVKINGQDTIAEVMALRGNDLEIAAGLMKITIRRNKVSLAEAPEKEPDAMPKSSLETSGINTKERLMHFKFELDVRGMMKEEVLDVLANWADDAILLGVAEAKIIHGKGNGVLKDTVRSVMRKYKEVEGVGEDPSDKSGDYVTMVKFRI